MESSDHIFFSCPATVRIWHWLKDVVPHLDASSCLNLIHSCVSAGCKFMHQVLISAITYSIWRIWIERNNRYFEDKEAHFSNLIYHIVAEVKMSSSLMVGANHSSSLDVKVSSLFQLSLRPSRQIFYSNVYWIPPRQGCIKINFDGASFGSPPCGATGVVFRDNAASFLGGFVHNIGHASALVTELSAAMHAIEKAVAMQWREIWMETDSLMVVKAFSQQMEVPWTLRTRWLNCLTLVKSFSCTFTHIHREGNTVADALAKNGLGLPSLHSQWWTDPPFFVLPLLQRDRTGLPYQRISYM